MNKLKSFFSVQELKMATILALCFSAFLYFFHFGYEPYFINSVLGLYAFYLLLTQNRKTLFFAGFIIGFLWFYWIGFSFIYYDMAWVVPLNALGFAFIYGFIFWVISYPSSTILRAVMLFLLSLFEPFDFNWLQPELLFVNSYFGIHKWEYILILIALALFAHFKKNPVFLLILLPALSFSSPQVQELPLDITLYQTDLDQNKKWNKFYVPLTVEENFKAIDIAIKEEKELIILPESAFPLFLNMQLTLIERLKLKSEKITIVTGSLYYENNHNYNASYYFHDGKLQIAKKMILVPFGEYIPLPSFLARPINEAVFGGAVDYLSASKPTDFKIKGTRFRNAICYEATCHEMYEDKPHIIIATSNNAWFTPSIQPTLQRLLMQFYATKNNTIILHSANAAGGGIIYP